MSKKFGVGLLALTIFSVTSMGSVGDELSPQDSMEIEYFLKLEEKSQLQILGNTTNKWGFVKEVAKEAMKEGAKEAAKEAVKAAVEKVKEWAGGKKGGRHLEVNESQEFDFDVKNNI